MLLNCGVGEDSWESLELQGDPTSPSSRKSVLNIHWKDWCWSWKLQYFGHLTWRTDSLEKTLMLGKMKAGREEVNRGWDGWIASPTGWTWVWVSSRSWWWRGKPGMLQSMGSQRVGHDWATELNWMTHSHMVSRKWLQEYYESSLLTSLTLRNVFKSYFVYIKLIHCFPDVRTPSSIEVWNIFSLHPLSSENRSA